VLPDVATVVAHVEVDAQPDGELLARWEFEGEPVAVDVATGFSADSVDHQHQRTVPPDQTSLRLSGHAGRRQFVSVAPHGGGPAVVAADRRVPFEGATNFRDLGGYRTRSGTRIRWGQVFRADALHGFSSEDLALYDRLGLRAVYDLRGELERNERPNPVPSRQLTVIGRPANTEAASPPPSAVTAADGEQLLHERYVGLIEHAAVQIGELYVALSEDDALPAVFHCHAGKDRTGVVAALLLDALGVERETILDDYELTARYRLRTHQESSYHRLVESGMSPEAAAAVLTTPRWAMQQALEDLDRRYGGVAEYLQGPAGMDPNNLRALRRRLVTSIPAKTGGDKRASGPVR
jgi:protein-tyrosine phosphatase